MLKTFLKTLTVISLQIFILFSLWWQGLVFGFDNLEKIEKENNQNNFNPISWWIYTKLFIFS